MHRQKAKLPSSRQEGAALVVALVLVLVSSLLGISAMQSSDIDTQMLNNNRFHQVAFREAEAATDRLLTLENIISVVSDASETVESTSSIDSNVSVSSSFKSLGDGPATGYSLGGQNGFRSLKFVAKATASISNVDSVSEIHQGVERLTFSREN